MRALEAAAGTSTARSSSSPTTRRSPTARNAGLGLTAPELAVLLAYAKITLEEDAARLAAARRPRLPAPSSCATSPRRCASDSSTAIARHPLRREIIATALVNGMVNRAGTTFAFRLARGDRRDRAPTSCAPTRRPARSSTRKRCGATSRRSTASSPSTCRRRCTSSPASSSSARAAGCCATAAGRCRSRRRVELLRAPRSPASRRCCPSSCSGSEREWSSDDKRAARPAGRAAPTLAAAVAALDRSRRARHHRARRLRTGRRSRRSPRCTAIVGDRLRLDWLRDRIVELPRDDRWHGARPQRAARRRRRRAPGDRRRGAILAYGRSRRRTAHAFDGVGQRLTHAQRSSACSAIIERRRDPRRVSTSRTLSVASLARLRDSSMSLTVRSAG